MLIRSEHSVPPRPHAEVNRGISRITYIIGRSWDTPRPFLHGQAAHFAHLFQNLIGNAIKYRDAAVPLGHYSV